MPTITIRLPDKLLHETRFHARTMGISLEKYIHHAIKYMNKITLKEDSTQKLKKASIKVRQESMKINAEFNRIEQDPKI